MSCTLTFFLAIYLAPILTYFLAFMRTVFLAFYLAPFRFYFAIIQSDIYSDVLFLTSALPTEVTEICSRQLRSGSTHSALQLWSGSAHRDLELAVEEAEVKVEAGGRIHL